MACVERGVYTSLKGGVLRHKVAGVVVCVSGLLACAQSVPGNSPGSPVNASAPASTVPLPAVRVVVQFNQPVAFQSAYFLQKLQVQTQAQVRYLGGVFQDTHVYSFQPLAGQTYAQLLQRLSTMPEVSRVELDQKTKAN